MKISIIQGDITQVKTEAIVNAAKPSLEGGGGVDGAIHEAAGSSVLEECKSIVEKNGEIKTGEAVITNAGKLFAKKIIHTVGPDLREGSVDEDKKLKEAYENSFKIAEEYGIQSIALPNISTGVYEFPKEAAAKIAIEAAKNHVSEKVKEVLFVCHDAENFEIYQKLLNPKTLENTKQKRPNILKRVWHKIKSWLRKK